MTDRLRPFRRAVPPVSVVAAFAAMVFAASQTPCQAQEQPPPEVPPPALTPATPQPPPAAEDKNAKPRPLGPGDPLPRLTLEFGKGTASSASGEVTLSEGALLTFGDVRLQAQTLSGEPDRMRLEADGGFSLTRGDETMRGSYLLVEAEQDNYFLMRDAVLISPPLYIAGGIIERTPTGLSAQNGMLTASPDGRGEWRVTYDKLDIENDRYLVLRGASLHLYGQRILTLRRYRALLRRGRDRERDEYQVSIPVSIRSSRIGGTVIATRYGFYLGAGYEGNVGVDFPSRGPRQYQVNLRKSLVGKQRVARVRGGFLDPTMRTDQYEGESPLRQFLRARPLPSPEDPVLDFEDILPSENPISEPTRTSTKDLRAFFQYAVNREVADRRQGFLLQSRLPEVRLIGRLPLAGTVPESNEEARVYLRRPRLVVSGDILAGNYSEKELQQDGRKISHSRLSTTATVETLPLLLGSRFLVRPQASYTHNAYSGHDPYRILETSVAAGLVLSTRTAISGQYIHRATQGTTPFTFDLIDARSEGQIRGQIGFGPRGKYTVAALGRYDFDQNQFFDFQLGLGIRGRSLEPRISYRKLGGQFNVTVALPGLIP